MSHRNVCNHIPDYTMSYPRRPQYVSSSMSKPQIQNSFFFVASRTLKPQCGRLQLCRLRHVFEGFCFKYRARCRTCGRFCFFLPSLKHSYSKQAKIYFLQILSYSEPSHDCIFPTYLTIIHAFETSLNKVLVKLLILHMFGILRVF